MDKEFIYLTEEGLCSNKSFIKGTLIIFFVWFTLIGGIASYLFKYAPQTRLVVKCLDAIHISETGLLVNYVSENIAFIFFFYGVYRIVTKYHHRKFFSIITTKSKINFKRMFIGFSIFFVFISLQSLIEYFIWPGVFSVSFDIKKFIIILTIGLILTPIQTTAEELFFRGYILQWMGLKIKNKYVILLLSGLIFMVGHFGNPEFTNYNVVLMAADYFCFGVLATLLTMKTNSIEVPIGMHAANNLFSLLIISYKDAALTTYNSAFYQTKIHPLYSLITLIIIAVIFYIIITKTYSENISLESII